MKNVSLVYNNKVASNLASDMRLQLDFFTATEHDFIKLFVTPTHTRGDEDDIVDALRNVITEVRTLVPVMPVTCRLVVLKGSDVLPNVPLMRRLVELVELASFQIDDVRIDQTSLACTLESHAEILHFIETFQTNVTLFCLNGTPVNDFVLTWWIDQVLMRPAFLPRLQVVWLATSLPLDEAVTLRLVEAFSQSPREDLGWLLFQPVLPTRHPSEILYLARLLQRAKESVHFTRDAMARTIGQYAFSVLSPMLPFARPAFRISHDPTLNDDVTPSFIFDESILENDGASTGFSGMTLQQYTEQRHLFDNESIVLTRRV